VVGVLDLDQRWAGEHALEQAHDDVAQPRRAELRRERLDLSRERRVDVEGDRQQRHPRQERRIALLDDGAQTAEDDVVRLVVADAEQRAQQLAPRGVRRRGAVGLAGGVQPAHSRGAPAQLVEQPALADPLLAGELDDPPGPAAGGGDRVVERGDLALAADQREVLGHALARAAADRGTDRPRLDGARLALHRERLERVQVEARRRAIEHPRGRIELSGRRAGHQPG